MFKKKNPPTLFTYLKDVFKTLAPSIYTKCVHSILETNALICRTKDEVLEQTDLFPSCSSSSLCRLEACSLSLALQWAQTWYDLNKPREREWGMKQYFFPLTQSSCFKTLLLQATTCYTNSSQTWCFYIMTPSDVFGSYDKAGAFRH